MNIVLTRHVTRVEWHTSKPHHSRAGGNQVASQRTSRGGKQREALCFRLTRGRSVIHYLQPMPTQTSV